MKEFLTSLSRLDRIIEKAVALAQATYGPQAAADPYRGLYINQDEVRHLLNREPGAPLLWSGDEYSGGSEPYDIEGSRMAWLKDACGLSPFDLDMIIIALAPELDTRYERLYAYLQDNVTRRNASVDLVLNLLCSTAEEKIERRAHFAPDAPLIRKKVIHLIAEPNYLQPSLLSHYIKLDEQIINLLLLQKGLDARLAPFCELIYPACGMDGVPLAGESKCALLSLTAHARRKRRQLHLYFQGPHGAGKRMTAEALAFETGMSLLVTDLAAIPYRESDFGKLLEILFREAWFKDALLCLDETDVLFSDEQAAYARLLLKALADDSGVTVLTGTKPWVQRGFGPMGVVTVPFTISGFGRRRHCWNESLTAENILPDESELDALANRFRLTRYQIRSAVASAKERARWNAAAGTAGEHKYIGNGKPTLQDVFTAARAQSGHQLAALAPKVDAKYTWNDIVLPQEAMTQLREMCRRVTYRHRVLGEWGFNAKLSLGKGVNALFSGPSGTGKTMAAEVIANELGLDLYKIDLSGVVSKYIGETEKNLDRIFTATASANAILFFDEADALFGKRSEVRDAHDRYANIEISYLLQKMEQYEGITILTTNLRQNLDDAFVRRMAFIINFPFPDQESRRRIWTGIWPQAVPLADDVDLEFLARQFKLSGGNIKNIALAASFLAAADGDAVAMAHLFRAAQHEYRKMGKTLSETELYGERKSLHTNADGS